MQGHFYKYSFVVENFTFDDVENTRNFMKYRKSILYGVLSFKDTTMKGFIHSSCMIKPGAFSKVFCSKNYILKAVRNFSSDNVNKKYCIKGSDYYGEIGIPSTQGLRVDRPKEKFFRTVSAHGKLYKNRTKVYWFCGKNAAKIANKCIPRDSYIFFSFSPNGIWRNYKGQKNVALFKFTSRTCKIDVFNRMVDYEECFILDDFSVLQLEKLFIISSLPPNELYKISPKYKRMKFLMSIEKVFYCGEQS